MSKIQDVYNWLSLPRNILIMFLNYIWLISVFVLSVVVCKKYIYNWVLLRVRARLTWTRYWKNAFFFTLKKATDRVNRTLCFHFSLYFFNLLVLPSIYFAGSCTLYSPPTNGALLFNYIESDPVCQVQCKYDYGLWLWVRSCHSLLLL